MRCADKSEKAKLEKKNQPATLRDCWRWKNAGAHPACWTWARNHGYKAKMW